MAAPSDKPRVNWGLTPLGLSPIAYDGTRTPLKTALFLLVCAAWLLPGLVGHDPWKVDEAVVFGAVSEIVRSGDWLAFRVAGEPLVDKAPLFLWVSAAFGKLFGGWLALHDAARLAAGAFMAATLGALTLASKELMGERALRMGVLLFIGCLGLLIRAHEMSTDLAGLTGVAVGLYGLALAGRHPIGGGAVAGLGMGLAFLGDGLLPLGMLLATLAAMPAASPSWRTRGQALTTAVALACAAPLVAAWPLLLASVQPELLDPWLENATTFAALRRGEGEPFALTYFARILPWYAWPAWPLAAWTIYRARRDLRTRRGLLLPAVACAAFFLVLVIFSEPREVNALPLLLPLALLGVAEIESVPRGAASALDWFGMTTFFLFAALIWIGWFAAMTGEPAFARAWLQREVPGFAYRFNFVAFALASMLTLIWLVVVARSLRSTRRALVNWSAGITMVWMLVMTLGVPLVDQARSYRALAARMAAEVPRDAGCIARRNVGDAQRALLDYFAGLRTIREDLPAASRCGVLLVQAAPNRRFEGTTGLEELWRGARPGDRNEIFVLYRRSEAARVSSISTQ